MLLTIFIALLAVAWLAAFLTAFCPLRAWRRRKELAEMEKFEKQDMAVQRGEN